MPTAGNQKGKAIQFTSAPCECDMVGPSFTPHEATLFLAIHQPGGAPGPVVVTIRRS